MECAAGTGGINLDAGNAAIGVDVGGTKTAIGLIDAATLTLLAKTVIATGRERGGNAVLRDVEEQVRSLDSHARSLGKRVAGVGVVVPENVSVAGRITSSAVMPGWDKLPVAERLGTSRLPRSTRTCAPQPSPRHASAPARTTAFTPS